MLQIIIIWNWGLIWKIWVLIYLWVNIFFVHFEFEGVLHVVVSYDVIDMKLVLSLILINFN